MLAIAADQQLAAVIHANCCKHIEIARFAQDWLQNPEAKQFAEKMVRDHTPGCDKLRQLAGDLAAKGPAGGEIPRQPLGPATRGTPDRPAPPPPGRPGRAQPEPRPEGNARADQPGADTPAEARKERRDERREERCTAGRRRGGGAAGRPSWRGGPRRSTGRTAQLGPDSAADCDQCLNTIKEQLEEHQRADFDQTYLGHEVMIHLATIDELTVLKSFASPALRADLDRSIAMAKEHLEEAKRIEQSLKGDGSEPRLSRQPGKTATPRPRRKEE